MSCSFEKRFPGMHTGSLGTEQIDDTKEEFSCKDKFDPNGLVAAD